LQRQGNLSRDGGLDALQRRCSQTVAHG
jgi:hypothetical protein